jgi:hypothetical protein
LPSSIKRPKLTFGLLEFTPIPSLSALAAQPSVILLLFGILLSKRNEEEKQRKNERKKKTKNSIENELEGRKK